MKRREWVVLAVVVGAVATLEVFGTGGDPARDARPASSVQAAPRAVAPTDPAADPAGVHRTVRLHVTGMT